MDTSEKLLSSLVSNARPVLNNGTFVFVTLKKLDNILMSEVVSMVREKEGFTLVLPLKMANRLELSYETLFSWITLEVHSSLEAVGFTAVFSKALANVDISCNVMAGYHHDHLFVPQKDSPKAMEVLKHLGNSFKES